MAGLKSLNKIGVNLLLSISDVARRLKVTRVTVYKWISMGILKSQGHQLIGSRHMYWFEPDYIDRVATLVPKHRQQGAAMLSPALEEKIKRLS